MFLFFQDSVDFCVICVVKNDDRDPIVEKVKEVSVDFACEANWMGGKRKSRRFFFLILSSFFAILFSYTSPNTNSPFRRF